MKGTIALAGAVAAACVLFPEHRALIMGGIAGYKVLRPRREVFRVVAKGSNDWQRLISTGRRS